MFALKHLQRITIHKKIYNRLELFLNLDFNTEIRKIRIRIFSFFEALLQMDSIFFQSHFLSTLHQYYVFIVFQI